MDCGTAGRGRVPADMSRQRERGERKRSKGKSVIRNPVVKSAAQEAEPQL